MSRRSNCGAFLRSVGLTNVETVIASRNVVFDAKAKTIETKLQAAFEKSLGYTMSTYVRSMEELTEIEKCKPFKRIPKNGTLFIAFN